MNITNIVTIAGLTFEVLGTVLIAYTALSVHGRVRKEHVIDEKVISEMKREHALGISGIVFILIGYVLQLIGVAL